MKKIKNKICRIAYEFTFRLKVGGYYLHNEVSGYLRT